MAKIAIDLDETLYSFESAFRDAIFDIAQERDDKSVLRVAYSNNYEWRNLVDHDMPLAFEAIERVHTAANSYTAFPNAADTVERIRDAGHEIKYVGSRKDKHYDSTMEFLDWNDFPGGELICTDPAKQSKVEDVADCQYLIDDRPKTIFEFLYDENWDAEYDGTMSTRRLAFSLWKPYNQNLTELKGLYLAPTWRGLRFYLERKGVI